MKEIMRIDTLAVSPVVGVMLMLTVTVAIAAIVAGFVGGLPDTEHRASNVALKATYSQTYGLTVTHMGGDTIIPADTVITARLTDTFGDAGHLSWIIDPSNIVIKRGADKLGADAWFTDAGSAGVYGFAAGDVAYIEPDTDKHNAGEYIQDGLKSDSVYSLDNASSIGNEFQLEFSDKSGMTFAKTIVIITP